MKTTARSVIEAFSKADLLDLVKPGTIWVCFVPGQSSDFVRAHTNREEAVARCALHCKNRWDRDAMGRIPKNDEDIVARYSDHADNGPATIYEVPFDGSRGDPVYLAFVTSVGNPCDLLVGASKRERLDRLAEWCRKRWAEEALPGIQPGDPEALVDAYFEMMGGTDALEFDETLIT